MPEIPDVIAGNSVLATWGNLIRDRALQRYADQGALDVSILAPVAGDFAYVIDEQAVKVWTGAAWQILLLADDAGALYLPLDGSGVMAGDLQMGDLNITGLLDPTAPQDAATKAYVDPGAWQTPTLINGWSNFGGSFRDARYRLNNGRCEVEGMLAAGTTAVATVLFTVAAGFRPSADNVMVVSTSEGNGRLDVRTNGDMRIDIGWQASSWGSVHTSWAVP